MRELDLSRVPPARRSRRSTYRQPSPSPTEHVVLRGIAEGLTNFQIGAATGLAEETVKTHIRHLLAKFNAHNRAHLVAMGYERGLLP